MAAFTTAILASLAILAATTRAQPEKLRGHALRDYNSERRAVYTASWAVEITQGGEKMAEHVAERYGFNNLGKVSHSLYMQKYVTFMPRLTVWVRSITLN